MAGRNTVARHLFHSPLHAGSSLRGSLRTGINMEVDV